MKMKIFFGTDGWRAHIDTEINQETVSVVAQAFADFIQPPGLTGQKEKK